MDLILDLGCGTGDTLAPYAHNHLVSGVDIDAKNIAICTSRYPNGFFIVGDITTVDIPKLVGNHKLKKVICTEVIEHVDNWKAVIKNASRVPSGTELIITTPYYKNERKLLNLRSSYWKEIGHQHFFTGKELKRELENMGWQHIQIRRTNTALYLELRSLFKKQAPCVRETYYENILPLWQRALFQLFRPNLFQTKLRYFFPLWIITLPLGFLVDPFFGGTLRITAIKQ